MRASRVLPGLLVGTLIVCLAGSAVADGPTPTSLRISAPSSVRAGAPADIDVRLLTSGGPVSGRTVVLQRKDPSGWARVATMTTRSDGLGHVAVAVGSSSRYRAYFRGDTWYGASTSPQVVVTANRTLGDRAITEAKRHRGQSYQYGAAGPTRFDCSGFTMYVFEQLGRSLPHNSGAQHDASRRIGNAQKRAGDLIFTSRGGRITHVGLYAGGTEMWSPVKSGDHVRLQSFSGRAYTVGRVG